MKIITCILLLSVPAFFSYGQENSNGKKQNADFPFTRATPTQAYASSFPLYLNDINFGDQKKYVTLDEATISRIDNLIRIYYIRESEGDSLQLASAISKVYFNTLQFRDSLHTIYLVLLRHEPTGYLNSKILFYDNKAKAFSEKVFDFNLHALYDFKEQKLTPSNLKVKLHIEGPEIDQLDYDRDGRMDYRFIRLVHNGTYNAIQTTVLTFQQLNVNTLSLLEAKL